jgi:sensor domain CHASE-containing protein
MLFGTFMMMIGLRWSIAVPGFLRVFQVIRFIGFAIWAFSHWHSQRAVAQAEAENQRRMEARIQALHRADK